jgi:hypothetical protein
MSPVNWAKMDACFEKTGIHEYYFVVAKIACPFVENMVDLQ